MCKFKDMAGKGLLKWSDQISESIRNSKYTCLYKRKGVVLKELQ